MTDVYGQRKPENTTFCIQCNANFCLWASRPPPGGGTRYIPGWGGAARPLIPWPCLRQVSLIFRFLIPFLRHLTQFKTKMDKSIPRLRQKMINSIPCSRQKSRKTYPGWPHVPIKPPPPRVKAPSTRTRICFNSQLFLCEFASRWILHANAQPFWIHFPEWIVLNPHRIWNRVNGRILIFYNPMTLLTQIQSCLVVARLMAHALFTVVTEESWILEGRKEGRNYLSV